MDLGAPELLIILVIVGLLFGANKLPGLARGMGSAVHEFKKGQAEGASDKSPEEKAAELKAAELRAAEMKSVETGTVTAPVEPADVADAKPAEPAQ